MQRSKLFVKNKVKKVYLSQIQQFLCDLFKKILTLPRNAQENDTKIKILLDIFPCKCHRLNNIASLSLYVVF